MSDFQYPEDIYTEAEPDVNTLANLGPLAPMAGNWDEPYTNLRGNEKDS